MPPTRGHDLKLQFAGVCPQWPGDAPHTGARLETNHFLDTSVGRWDAPHTGARLETWLAQSAFMDNPDAPHTGARLETQKIGRDGHKWRMPPTRGHDLKPDLRCKQGADHKMPPTRGHDLKPHLLLGIPLFFDAPHTGARLETRCRTMTFGAISRCPPHGGTT